MADFVNNDLTAAGRRALALAAAGKRLNFTKLVMGTGQMQEDTKIWDLTGMSEPKAVLDIVKCDVHPTDGTVRVVGIYTNAQEQSGWYYRELGLFAEIDGEEILYAYANCGDHAEWIPAIGGTTVIEKTIDVRTIIGPATNVSAYINADAYATVGQYEEVKAIALAAQNGAVQALGFSEHAIQICEALREMLNAHIGEYASLLVQLKTLYDSFMTDVKDNPWSVTFTDLDGITLASGVWNQPLARLEC